MKSPNPIFDQLVAEFAQRGIAYINIVGGIRPGLKYDEGMYVKPAAGPFGMNVTDNTISMDAVKSLFLSKQNKVVCILDDETVTSETEPDPLLDDTV